MPQSYSTGYSPMCKNEWRRRAHLAQRIIARIAAGQRVWLLRTTAGWHIYGSLDNSLDPVDLRPHLPTSRYRIIGAPPN